ncbi:MAG: hypothetical protein KDK70_36610, partial [Myxococcales bacterium]|nr:hypothetical protein [Myxococcales bacterium]
ISSFLATRRLLLSPELYLRARTLDVGAIAGTTFSSLAVAAYPEQRDFLVEPWGLGWLHLLATNDLYSYYRERDESTFNLVHVVHAAQSELVPTSVAQAVDAVVRLCNLLQDRLEQLTEELALEWGPRSTVGRHIEAFCWAPTGGLDFLRAHPHRYRDPATLSDYDVELCGVVDAYRQSWWHPSHWDAVQRFIAPHRVTALCSSAWQFALAGAEPRPTTYATAVPYAVADTRASWRPQA